MRNSWNMITVTYHRIPARFDYDAVLCVDNVSKGSEGELIEVRKTTSSKSGALGALVDTLHDLLHQYPDAKVTMLQEASSDHVFRRPPVKGYELDQITVDLIKNDVEAAKQLFRPIEHRISVSPFRVSMPIKEMNDAD